jgi:hypothetical protein
MARSSTALNRQPRSEQWRAPTVGAFFIAAVLVAGFRHPPVLTRAAYESWLSLASARFEGRGLDLPGPRVTGGG